MSLRIYNACGVRGSPVGAGLCRARPARLDTRVLHGMGNWSPGWEGKGAALFLPRRRRDAGSWLVFVELQAEPERGRGVAAKLGADASCRACKQRVFQEGNPGRLSGWPERGVGVIPSECRCQGLIMEVIHPSTPWGPKDSRLCPSAPDWLG